MEKGRSTGVGYVRFANYEDAHRAIGILLDMSWGYNGLEVIE